MPELPDHAQASLVELQRERAQEMQIVADQELVKSAADLEISRASHRIGQIDDLVKSFVNLYIPRIGTGAQVEPDLQPGGPCPLSDDDLLAMAREGGYPEALVALARATPGHHLHGRTASRWLMDARVLTGNLDASRTKISKHMGRSKAWEQIAPGWYRLLDPEPAHSFPFTTPEEPPGPDGEDTDLVADHSGTSARC